MGRIHAPEIGQGNIRLPRRSLELAIVAGRAYETVVNEVTHHEWIVIAIHDIGLAVLEVDAG